jgi:hypothetical protein
LPAISKPLSPRTLMASCFGWLSVPSFGGACV